MRSGLVVDSAKLTTQYYRRISNQGTPSERGVGTRHDLPEELWMKSCMVRNSDRHSIGQQRQPSEQRLMSRRYEPQASINIGR